LNDFKNVKIAITGILPFLLAVDCLTSAIFFSIFSVSAMFVTAAFLYPLKNYDIKLKYPAAVFVSLPFNLALYNFFLSKNYYIGWNSEIYIFLTAFSMAGIYLGGYSRTASKFSEYFKHFSIMASVSVSIFMITGLSIELLKALPALSGVNALYYPGPVIILAGLLALGTSKILEKLI